MTCTSTASRALLLRCPHCGQAFAEMLALIGDFRVEAPEEAADGLVYAAVALIRDGR